MLAINFNYISLVGQPRIPLCYNAHSITTSAIDTATVLVSNVEGESREFAIESGRFYQIDIAPNQTGIGVE
jgi:hypothetical protein